MTPDRPDPDQPLPLTACAVCGHVINHHKDEQGERWIHSVEADDDHAPVPAPVESTHTSSRCDFCLALDARWILPVEDYETSEHDNNTGDWTVCDICTSLIGKNDWDALTTRSMEAMRTRLGRMTPPRSGFERMYRELRSHIIGHLHTVHVAE